MAKASSLIFNRVKKGDIDLLLLPEMAFSGYVFKSREEISPFLENIDHLLPGTSQTSCPPTSASPPSQSNKFFTTFEWCQHHAKTLECYIAAGYPQIHEETEEETEKRIQNRPKNYVVSTQNQESKTKYLNSLMLVSPQGELVVNYSKHFLYETDKTWADEGCSFVSVELPEWQKKIGFGVCMDINPYEYLNSSLKEFANFHKKAKTDIILFAANWIDSDPEEEGKSLETASYWVQRLSPLIGSGCVFVAANRVGKERGTLFCGSSTIIHLGKKPAALVLLGKREENCVITTTPSQKN
eukprot:TRINITY_DN1810_c0_g2_i2.p1 TRINITY_DN1810_c0_g2~~TRINITY_DN1810_c0_g2_i2.p1  ORF type:complete len:298 (+),score=76.07 TRINITY_DN1810_c0_g2_i2:60-953(+)